MAGRIAAALWTLSWTACAGRLPDDTFEFATPGERGRADATRIDDIVVVADAISDGEAEQDGLADAGDAADGAADVTATTADAGLCTDDDDCPAPVGGACLKAVCAKASGLCTTEPVADGVTCDDGNPCTADDACGKGTCWGPTTSCDDGNACTADSCDSAKGCVSVHTAAPCDDGDLCTVGDACQGGVCEAGKIEGCDDKNPCTDDGKCTPGGGCQFAAKVDGSGCGFNVVCKSGACVPDCAALPDGKPCDDANACTTGETCTAGKCLATTAYQLVTVAGGPGFADGAKGLARFYYPADVAVAPDGFVWVADRHNHAIRRLSSSGVVTTIADDGIPGDQDGLGAGARLNYPHGVDVDAKGVGWIADTNNHRIRRLSGSGEVVTIAGAKAGFTNGKGLKASFSSPRDVAVAKDGTLFVADYGNHAIRRVATDGVVSTFAGGSEGAADGKGSAASFQTPQQLALGPKGALWVTDTDSHRVRKVSADGTVTTIAGSGKGSADGKGIGAQFTLPIGIAVDASGIVYVGDTGNHRIRRVGPDGLVSTILGSTSGLTDGAGAQAKLNSLAGVALDQQGHLWVADQGNQRIRRASRSALNCDDGATCTTDACDPSQGCTHANLAKGAACEDGKLCTSGDTCDPQGVCQGGAALVCKSPHPCAAAACDDQAGCTLAALADGAACGKGRTCHAGDCVAITCAGQPASSPCQSSDACVLSPTCVGGACQAAGLASLTTWAGDGQAGTTGGHREVARLYLPAGLALAADGAVLFSDYSARVRRVTPAGQVETVAGSGVVGFADGKAHEAAFNSPWGLVVGGGGAVLVADAGNDRIRRVSLKGDVSTLAGGVSGYLDGIGAGARFHRPTGMAHGPAGSLVVCDESNRRVRAVSSAGAVSTIAGSGLKGHEDGSSLQASFQRPRGVDVDVAGVIYVADLEAHRIRRIGLDGLVTTVAGDGKASFADGPATSASFQFPAAVTVGPFGALWVADSTNRRVRRIDTAGQVTTVAGTGANGMANGPPLQATLGGPNGLLFDAQGRLLIADRTNHTIRLLAWPSKTCDDANPCTKDACDTKTGACEHSPDAGAKPTGGCSTEGGCSVGLPVCSGGKLLCQSVIPASKMAGKACEDDDICSVATTCQAGKCAPLGKWLVDTIVGGQPGFTDGPAAVAKLLHPRAVASDPKGNAYVADNSHRIRRISPSGHVTTVAGDGLQGAQDGKGAQARFASVAGLAWHPDGYLLVADTNNHTLRRLLPDGTVQTLAGAAGIKGAHSKADDGKGAAARFDLPIGLAINDLGVTWIVDQGSNRIRTMAADLQVSTLAGDGTAGSNDGPLASARFHQPQGLAWDGKHALYVADTGNHRVRRIDLKTKVVQTLAGSVSGFADGKGSAAKFNTPVGVVLGLDGLIWVADAHNYRVRAVAGDGAVTTVAGTSNPATTDGPASQAAFKYLSSICLGAPGTILVGSWRGHALRRIRGAVNACDDGQSCTVDACAPKTGCSHTAIAKGLGCEDGDLCTIDDQCGVGGFCVPGKAKPCDDGNPCTEDSCLGDSGCAQKVLVNGTSCGASAVCKSARCLATSCKGKPDGIPCDDGAPCTLLDRCKTGQCQPVAEPWIETLAGAPPGGFSDGHGAAAGFAGLGGIAWCPDGALWIAAPGSHRIRRMAADGTVTTVAGSGVGWSTDGKGDKAELHHPADVVCDGAGNAYVAGGQGHVVLRVLVDGTVSTLAGKAGKALSIDGLGAAARFSDPRTIAISPSGALYVADYLGHCVRELTPQGKVVTIAGTVVNGKGVAGYQDGPAGQAKFNNPYGIAVDQKGRIWVADRNSPRIRRIEAGGKGVVTVAGSGKSAWMDGVGAAASFQYVESLAIGPDGALYVAEPGSLRIRRVDDGGKVTTLAGIGTSKFVDGPAKTAPLGAPVGLAFDHMGRLLFSDNTFQAIRRLTPTKASCMSGKACDATGCAP